MPNRKEAPKGTQARRMLRLSLPSAHALAAAAAFAAGLLYLPALRHGWVWDDALLVATRGAGGAAADGFRPLIGWLQQGEWWLGAGNPALFHATGLLIHAVGTWLVFLLASHVGLAAWPAFVAALLFAAHPIHVESVAYVTGRPAMIAAVLSLGAILAARTRTLRSPEGSRSRTIFWAYGLYALAALADDAAIVVPFLLWGVDRWGPSRVPARQRRGHYAGFLAVWLVANLIRVADPPAIPGLVERGVAAGHQGAALLLAMGTYLQLLLWPHPLNAMRSIGAAEAAEAGAWLRLAAFAVAFAAVGWWRRGDAAARVGLLILGLGLLPALPFSGFATPYAAERSAYLASAGFCLLVGAVAAWAVDRIAATPVVAAGVLLAGAAGVGTMARLPAWQDNVTLLRAAAEADPRDPQPYLRLAEQHAAVGNTAGTLEALDLALERDSTIAEVHSRRALVLGTMGRWADAESSARRAIALDPDGAEAWANLGDALTQQGELEEAVTASRRAVALDSTHATIWYNYGVSLAATGDGDGAERAYLRSLQLDSTLVQAWNNLGALYGGRGMIPEARDAYVKAVELAPATPQARMNLALAYLRLGDKERAAEQRQVLQRLDPNAARRLSEFFQEVDTAPGVGPPRPNR